MINNYFKAFTLWEDPGSHGREVASQGLFPFNDEGKAGVALAYGEVLAWVASHKGARVSVWRGIGIRGAWSDVRVIGDAEMWDVLEAEK